MKKKLLSLILVLAMLLSCVLVLTSCPDDTPDGPPASNPELDLDENVPGGAGSQGIGVVTDPNSPEAGADADGNYTSDKQ